MMKYSTFSLSLRIPVEVSGGLYHVTTFSTSPAQSSLEPGVPALSSDTQRIVNGNTLTYQTSQQHVGT